MTAVPLPSTATLLDELDSQLVSSVRQAASRAEHMRLTRIQSLLADLRMSMTLPTPPTEGERPRSITAIHSATAALTRQETG